MKQPGLTDEEKAAINTALIRDNEAGSSVAGVCDPGWCALKK
ncbi:MAG: hypothetical protein P1U87_20880 [Verrucomicrobiales bacterium]|nr:hypothetical protein [Verrucomicrobiales bacterium]